MTRNSGQAAAKMSNAIAVLDRRIQVVAARTEMVAKARRISELSEEPFVVLLGEPGIGKSTVLKTEAEAFDTSVVRVRALLTGIEPPPGDILVLDALDEYRIDGSEADKIYKLSAQIKRLGRACCRLACRSEDWRKGADIELIEEAAGVGTITVAALLPLDLEEAEAVLSALGETDPEAFLRKASNLGAHGFIESPLTLRLLQTAVAQGDAWPETRFDLFDLAARRLSHEHDDRRRSTRPSPDAILDAVARAFLILLVSGARALWRSNAEFPRGLDRSEYLRSSDVGTARELLDFAVDTPLFRGEGEEFEPMHLKLWPNFLGPSR